MAIIKAKLTAAERRAGVDLRDVLRPLDPKRSKSTRTRPRTAARTAEVNRKLGPHERHAGSELERLVDDYLEKHVLAVRANIARDHALKSFASDAEKHRTLTALLTAHNERAAALRVLMKARGFEIPTRGR